jgi:hypothetical protein
MQPGRQVRHTEQSSGFMVQQAKNRLSNVLGGMGFAHAPERRRIDQVHVAPDQVLESPLVTGLAVLSQQFSVIHSCLINGRPNENRTAKS